MCTIEIRCKPRAKSDRIKIISDGKLDVAVTSPPADNEANEHIIKLLAGALGVPKSRVNILRGGHSRHKVASVEGVTWDTVVARLANCVG